MSQAFPAEVTFYIFDKPCIKTRGNSSCPRNFKVKYKMERVTTDGIICEIQESLDPPTNGRIKFITYLVLSSCNFAGIKKISFKIGTTRNFFMAPRAAQDWRWSLENADGQR